MALRINTNVSALNAHKNMIKNDNKLSSSLERLSSGLRINKAADDASGMSIADSLRSQGMGLGQAIKNANDGINIVQTADAALDESINIVNTIKTKSIQAAQDGQTTESRAAIQSDIDKLMEELDIIAKTTSFNGQKLLSGQFTDKKFQIGAYSGETVNISIGSAESSKIGHVTTGTLSLANDAPGKVELALYSTLQDKNYELEATDVKYNNSRENSMAAVADSINKLSDVLGISAAADVSSRTSSTVGAGTLDEFSINGVVMNGVNVMDNDSDGSLTKAINSKTSQHGVRATVDASGFMNLTSTDGRAIEVKADPDGLNSVFKGDDLSTVGTLRLTQNGSNDIVVTNKDGGDAVTLTSRLDISSSEKSTSAATAETGSVIAKNSVLGAGWTTNQDIATKTAFTDDITTTESSTLAKGSVLDTDSIVEFQGIIHANVTAGQDTSATTADGTIAVYSEIKSTSILGAGSVIGSSTTLMGDSTIEATAATTGDSSIADESILAEGSILASKTTLTGTDVTILQTADTVGESTIKEDSTLAAGSVIAASTVLGNSELIVQATEVTTAESTIASGSTLNIGTVIGNGTILSGSNSVTIFATTEGLTQTTRFSSGTTLEAGTVLKGGTVLASGVSIKNLSGATIGGVSDVSVTLSGDVTLQEKVEIVDISSGIKAAAGSTLGNNTIIASGSTVYTDITLASKVELNSGGGADWTAKVGTSLADGSTLASGSTMGVDITLKSAAALTDDMTAKTGSSLADGTSLKALSIIAADITLKNSATLGGTITDAKAGSSFADGTILKKDSDIEAELTLEQASTLSGDMVLTKELGLGAGSILAEDSVVREGSDFTGQIKLSTDTSFTKDQTLGAGSTIESTDSFIKAGSVIGGSATVKQDITVIKDAFTLGAGTKLANNSMLANGSTLGGTVTLSNDETVAAGSQMKLERGSTIADGSVITAGTYLTNDITADDGNVYKAGAVLEATITTSGSNKLTEAMTLKEGSVIAGGSKIAANAGGDSATAQVTGSSTNRLSDVSVLTQDSAQIAIAVADATLKDLDKVRADLGSVQNQLTSTIANISTTQVNVFSAESSIRDVDFAEESSNFTKLQILQQAGTFAMSQANASAQGVLSLLQ